MNVPTDEEFPIGAKALRNSFLNPENHGLVSLQERINASKKRKYEEQIFTLHLI